METIRVNMNPNPLDVQTIHASQNDNEARQWGFELHNNGELIDTSDVKEQLFFKAYKGGTEQILPENTSTPTTSPFKGDIKYPQGLLTDQEFTYRQSPTEEDGLAKITDIKGNTLNWNQIFIPQYRSQSGIQSNEIQDGNDYSVRIFGTATANAWLRMDATGTLPVGHKFLLDKGSTSNLFDINNDNNGLLVDFSVKTKIGTITTADKYIYIFVGSGTTIDVTVKPMLIDLTQMGLDSLTDAEILKWFADYFPLSYYSYNQGSLLSFMGNGIKTVGFNQWDEEWENGYYDTRGVFVSYSDNVACKNKIKIVPSIRYNIHSDNGSIGRLCFYDGNEKIISTIAGLSTLITNFIVTTPNNAMYMTFDMKSTYGTTYNNDICINISDASKNGTYEPYTSSTLSLPISTYFPTGMKSAGSVYDELTESKATTRIGAVDLGTLTWNKGSALNDGSGTGFYTTLNPYPGAFNGTEANIVSSRFIGVPYRSTWESISNGQMFEIVNGRLVVGADSSYADGNAFKTAMSGVYLYYELATPTETPITTASLVTENAEIPLSNEDGVLIGKCTERLSSESGFFDAKIKLADEDGECYSNKIQLHVERSPQ